MDVELRHLRAFVAVATARSFTAASRDLLITQPALTRTIQQLERLLGARLLERTSRSVSLTTHGHDFLATAQRVLSDLDTAVDALRGARTLRVGFQWMLPDPWTHAVLERFESTTGVKPVLLRRDDIAAELASGSVDVAIVRAFRPTKGIKLVKLFSEPRVATVAKDSPLASRASLTWDELADYPLVVNTLNGTTTLDLWADAHRPVVGLECRNWDEWIEAVASGQGIGATPLSSAREGTHPGVVFVPIADAPLVALRLAYNQASESRLVRQFIEVAGTEPSPGRR